MPQSHPDPMRYLPTKEELEQAFANEAPCHNLTHRLAERETEYLERILDDS